VLRWISVRGRVRHYAHLAGCLQLPCSAPQSNITSSQSLKETAYQAHILKLRKESHRMISSLLCQYCRSESAPNLQQPLCQLLSPMTIYRANSLIIGSHSKQTEPDLSKHDKARVFLSFIAAQAMSPNYKCCYLCSVGA
jgi:hypothetical protein